MKFLRKLSKKRIVPKQEGVVDIEAVLSNHLYGAYCAISGCIPTDQAIDYIRAHYDPSSTNEFNKEVGCSPNDYIYMLSKCILKGGSKSQAESLIEAYADISEHEGLTDAILKMLLANTGGDSGLELDFDWKRIRLDYINLDTIESIGINLFCPSSISAIKDLPKDFIEKHSNILNWSVLSYSNFKEDKDFLINNPKFDWDAASYIENLSIEFLKKYRNKINWLAVFLYHKDVKKISKEFKKEFAKFGKIKKSSLKTPLTLETKAEMAVGILPCDL